MIVGDTEQISYTKKNRIRIIFSKRVRLRQFIDRLYQQDRQGFRMPFIKKFHREREEYLFCSGCGIHDTSSIIVLGPPQLGLINPYKDDGKQARRRYLNV